MKRTNPLAQGDLKKLPAEDQRTIAMALGMKTQLCSRCPKPADTTVEFGLSWLDGVPEAATETRVFCAESKPTNPTARVKCGRHDTLEQTEATVRSLVPQGRYHILGGLRCKNCHTLAVAPLSTGEKRKWDQIEWAVEKRVCLRV